MEKLAKLFQERLNMSEELAVEASNLAFDFMKEQLPDAVSEHLDVLVSSNDISDAVTDKLKEGFGGLLGGD